MAPDRCCSCCTTDRYPCSGGHQFGRVLELCAAVHGLLQARRHGKLECAVLQRHETEYGALIFGVWGRSSNCTHAYCLGICSCRTYSLRMYVQPRAGMLRARLWYLTWRRGRRPACCAMTCICSPPCGRGRCISCCWAARTRCVWLMCTKDDVKVEDRRERCQCRSACRRDERCKYA